MSIKVLWSLIDHEDSKAIKYENIIDAMMKSKHVVWPLVVRSVRDSNGGYESDEVFSADEVFERLVDEAALAVIVKMRAAEREVNRGLVDCVHQAIASKGADLNEIEARAWEMVGDTEMQNEAIDDVGTALAKMINPHFVNEVVDVLILAYGSKQIAHSAVSRAVWYESARVRE